MFCVMQLICCIDINFGNMVWQDVANTNKYI